MPDFLNQYMAEAWPDMVDTLRCEVISQARVYANQRGLSIPLDQVITKLESPPHFDQVGNSLRGRLPAKDAHQFSMGVHWRQGPVDISAEVHVQLIAEMLIDQKQGSPSFQVSVGGDILTDIIDLTQFVKKQIQDSVTRGIGQQLGMFNTMRFDRSRVPAAATPQVVHGHAALGRGAAIDIAFVSDGFAAGEMGQFRDIVSAFRRRLIEPSSTHDNEPYVSFRNVLRLWSYEAPLAIPAGTATDQLPLYRALTGYYDPPTSSWKVSWSNLAILDAIGSQVSQLGADVLVFVTNRDTLPDVSVRAAGVGAVIMLPASAATAEEAATTLLHELGHTRLGKLADEYSESGYGVYLGPEPAAPNVTTQVLATVPPSTPKWPLWALMPQKRPAWDDQPIGAVPGARYYTSGIFRPAQECKMREVERRFCAVCREAVTRQMLTLLPSPEFLLEAASVGAAPTRLQLTVPAPGGAFPGRLSAGKPMQVTLLACPLPEPWQLGFSGPGISEVAANRCTVNLRSGECLTIRISSTCPFTPWSQLPSYELQLWGAEAAHPGPAQPSKVQGILLAPISGGWPCLLQATTRNPDTDAVLVEFTLERTVPETASFRQSTIWLTPAAAGGEVVATVQRFLTSGTYRLKAQARDRKGGVSAESAWTTFVVPPSPR